MLPQNLVSSYTRYKQDTDAIAAWLATTANRCGYISEAKSRSARKKGKARKAGQASQTQQAHGRTYTIPIKDFITLAEFIADNADPQIQVPPKFGALLERTITARQFFSASIAPFLEGDQKKIESDDRHAFFLGTLEKVRNILRPHYSSKHVPSAKKPESMQDVVNMFEHLEVEDTSDAFNNAPDVTVPPSIAPSNDATYKAEREEEDIMECYMAFQLLLQDLQRIRGEVGRAWEGYKQGLVDIVAASITTNTAVDLAQRYVPG